MAKSRLELRKMAEAAEESATKSAKKTATKKKAKRKTTKRAKDAPVRKQLVWVVFSGSMKEEARFSYDERKQAEAKLEQLQSKSKKPYFLQGVKEIISDTGTAAAAPPSIVIDDEEPEAAEEVAEIEEDAEEEDSDDDDDEEE